MAVSGNTLLVGAPGTNLEEAHNGGAAFIFQRQDAEWVESARLLPDLPQIDSGFGQAVAIDGGTAVVGARYEFNPGNGNGSGAVYVFAKVNEVWQLQARLAVSAALQFIRDWASQTPDDRAWIEIHDQRHGVVRHFWRAGNLSGSVRHTSRGWTIDFADPEAPTMHFRHLPPSPQTPPGA